MRINDLIDHLRIIKSEIGNVQLSVENDDGRSTFLTPLINVTVRQGYTPWKGHSQKADVIFLS